MLPGSTSYTWWVVGLGFLASGEAAAPGISSVPNRIAPLDCIAQADPGDPAKGTPSDASSYPRFVRVTWKD